MVTVYDDEDDDFVALWRLLLINFVSWANGKYRLKYSHQYCTRKTGKLSWVIEELHDVRLGEMPSDYLWIQ